MLNRHTALRLFAAGAAVAWCLLFLHSGTTDKSMVRAILLQEDAQGWTVGFLYQAPEPSADASEATAEVAFSAAGGQSLALALSEAEKTLPQQANYRLCDYVLLASDSDASLLKEYEQAVLERQCGRLAAHVMQCGFDGETLSELSEETEALPEKLLQCVKQAAEKAPRLYERESGLLLPVLTLTEDGAECADEAVFWDGAQELVLTANQTQAALLLQGRGEGSTFRFEGQIIELERAVCSVTAAGQERFVLRVDCLPKAGSQVPDPERQALEELLTGTVQLFWSNGADLLGLREALLLRSGRENELLPTKNACPQLRTDVKIYEWF